MFESFIAVSKMITKYMLLTAILSTFTLMSATILESALSESNIQLSDEGNLVYSSLSDRVKLNLFKNYQTTFKKEVITDSH
jgi:hypothetical protein